jgi:hypothetical protein
MRPISLLNGFNFMRQSQNRWYYTLTALAAFIILASVYSDLYQLFRTETHYDVYHFYCAARALILGTNLYESGRGGYIYPPFFAFIFTPLGHFSINVAQVLWLDVNLLLIILILFLGLRVLASGFQLTFTRWQAIGACALAVVLTHYPLHRELTRGESDLVILAGFALALFWLDRKPLLAGCCLGMIATIKYHALFFLPFLLFRARWRAAIGLVTGVAAGAFIPALMIGWGRNLEYLHTALRGIANMVGAGSLPVNYAARVPKITWSSNVSITSGLARIFLDHGWPQVNALILASLIALLTFFFLRWVFQQQGIPLIWRTQQMLGNPQHEKIIINVEWCILLIGMLIFSPQCVRRHLVLLLNVNLLAAVMLLFPRPNLKRWPLWVGILVSQFPLTHYWAYESYIGLPAWGYLVFLLLIIPYSLAYYRNGAGTPVAASVILSHGKNLPA